MKIGLIELKIQWEAKELNYERASSLIGIAAREGCDLVVLPEMFNTGFSMNIDRIGEEINGPTDTFLSGIAKRYGLNLIAGFPVREKGEVRGRNIAAVYNRHGRRIAEYTKIKPFPSLSEHIYYEAGLKKIVFEIDGIPSSVFICFDLRFPELFREVARDVMMIFVLANWPSSREDHWRTLLKARAIENQCFVTGVNRKGFDGNNIHYSGGSGIFNPMGEAIELRSVSEELLIGTIDPKEVLDIRSRYPFLMK